MPHHPLTGVLEATTAPQEALVLRAVEVARADPRLLAGYLVGGFAVGTGDAFSDVDLQFVVAADAMDDVTATWRDIVEAIAPAAHVGPFPGTVGGMVITPDWLHYDVVFLSAADFDASTLEGFVPLFDEANLLPELGMPRPERQGDPFFPTWAVEHFLYMLGNMVSVVGRDEPVPLSNGVLIVRDLCLVRLLLAEQGWQSTREHALGNPFPFTKRLRAFLTEEQHELLCSLPPIVADLDAGIDGFVALARAFIPRAKRLAVQTGAEWPAAYERASVAYFERMTGASLGPLDAVPT